MKLKWGVIGAGGIALRRTIPEAQRLAANVELVSVMDIHVERARMVAENIVRMDRAEEILRQVRVAKLHH